MLGKRLKELREKAGYTQQQLADLVKLSQQTIGHYEVGRARPDTDTLELLADIFGTTTDFLLGRSDERTPKLTDLLPDAIPVGERILLPVIGVVKAGPNGLAYEEHLGEEYADKDSINGGIYYWLQVKGDSMTGDGIMPGDLALVREQPDVEYGEIGIAIVDGEEGTLKRVYRKDDSIVLQSSNPAHPPRIFAGKEVSRVRIVGKVKEIKRKF